MGLKCLFKIKCLQRLVPLLRVACHIGGVWWSKQLTLWAKKQSERGYGPSPPPHWLIILPLKDVFWFCLPVVHFWERSLFIHGSLERTVHIHAMAIIFSLSLLIVLICVAVLDWTFSFLVTGVSLQGFPDHNALLWKTGRLHSLIETQCVPLEST